MTTAFATVVSAMIGAVVSIVVCVINNNKQNSKQTALIAYRLEQLEKKVEAHNNLVDRMYRVEEQTALQDEKIKVANNRIADLEKAGGKIA